MRKCKDGRCKKVRDGEENHPEHGKSRANRNVIFYGIIFGAISFLFVLTPDLIKIQEIKDDLFSVWVAVSIGVIGVIYALYSSQELKNYVEWARYVQHATTYFNDRDWEYAINYYDKALEITPKNLALLNNAGAAYAYLEKHEKAIPYYKKILEIEPNNVPALNNLGLALERSGKYSDSQACYEKALKIDQNDIDTLNNFGVLYYDTYQKYERSLEFYNRILDIDPTDIIARNNKARALISLQRFDEAILCCDEALKIDPKNVEALNEKARAFLHLEQYQEVISCGKLAMKIFPWHVKLSETKGTQAKDLQYKIIFNMALALGKLGRFEEAKKYFDQYLAVKPNDPHALRFKGDSLAAENNFKEAIFYYNKSLKINPHDYEVLSLKGTSLIALGKTIQGILCLNESIKLKKTHNLALYNKAFYLSTYPGNEKEIEEIYREIIQENPLNEDEAFQRARALYFLKDFEPAKSILNDLLRNNPNDVGIILAKANLLYETGNFTESIQNCNKILQLDHRNLNALTVKGSSLVKIGESKRAIETCFNQVLQFDPLNISAHYNEGVALTEERKFNEAVICYTTLQEIDPNHVNSWINKGECLRELGKYYEAIDCYHKVLSLDPKFTKILGNISYSYAKLENYQLAWQWWYDFLEKEGLGRDYLDNTVNMLTRYFNSPQPRGPLRIISV